MTALYHLSVVVFDYPGLKPLCGPMKIGFNLKMCHENFSVFLHSLVDVMPKKLIVKKSSKINLLNVAYNHASFYPNYCNVVYYNALFENFYVGRYQSCLWAY